MALKATFTGKRDGEGLPLEYLVGIPARSLTEEEYGALDKDQKAQVRASALYQMADTNKVADKPAPGGGE